MEVTYGVVSYRAEDGVGVGRATVEKVSDQMVNEVADWYDGLPLVPTLNQVKSSELPPILFLCESFQYLSHLP